MTATIIDGKKKCWGLTRFAKDPQRMVNYWQTKFDWRAQEKKLNELPQFMTTIDGLDIHFVHVKSSNPNAMPLMLVHGWPGSIVEFTKIIGPLTEPQKYGGNASDAFHVVALSLPGYGFSGKPQERAWSNKKIASVIAQLMPRLGYTRFVSQGGDCGSVVSHRMAMQKVKGLVGIHVNMPATVPPEIARLIQGDTSLCPKKP